MAKRTHPKKASPRTRDTELLERRDFFAAHIAGSSASYSTIQAAVNAASSGSTITVDAGTYAETVTVGKRLTILGAKNGVDARSNQRRESGSETTITGAGSGTSVKTAFYVTVNGVTIDGFIVQGVTDQSLTKGAGIVIAPNISGTKIQNNIVQNNVAGLYLANNSSSDAAVVRHNVFRNNNKDGVHGGRAIYTDQTISGGRLTNVSIDENTFSFNYGGASTTHLEAAIAFESGTNRQSQTNLNITGNVFDDNGKAILAINVDGMKFTGNVVTRGRDFYSGIVRFEGNDHNVTIKDNNLYNNTGAAVAVDVKGFPGNNSEFVVTDNNIYGNGTIASKPENAGKKLGIVVNGDAYDGTFDARNNYWGSSTGPSGDGPGSGDSIYAGPGDPDTGKWKVSTTKGDAKISAWATSPVTGRDTAYWGLPATDGYRIQAEDFNFGGKGVSYNDTTTGNSSGLYRNTDVDLVSTGDSSGGYAVAGTATGEWLDYAVKIGKTGTYKIDLRLASSSGGATIRILVDGQQLGSDVSVRSTGSSTSFTTLSLSNKSLTAGSHTIRVQFVNKNSSGSTPAFNWMQLTSGGTTTPTPTPTPTPGNSTSLTSLKWTSATSDYLTPQVNQSIKGNTLTLRGTTYATGIGTHANSTIEYDLAGKYDTFSSGVGIDDETNGLGAAVFQVWGDGVLLYDSGKVTGTSSVKTFSISVKGVQTLTLKANSVNGDIDYAHADWAGASLTSK